MVDTVNSVTSGSNRASEKDSKQQKENESAKPPAEKGADLSSGKGAKKPSEKGAPAPVEKDVQSPSEKIPKSTSEKGPKHASEKGSVKLSEKGSVKLTTKGSINLSEKASKKTSDKQESLQTSEKDSKHTKDTAQRTIPDHPDPSTKGSSGAYIDFGQLHAPDDVTDVRSDYTPIGIAKAKSEERLAISHKRSPKSYGSRSDLQSSFIPPTIRMDEPPPEGPEPVQTTCKYCYKMVKTDVKFVANEKTYTMCLLLFILLLWPFVWIPFCVKSCKEAVHRCPNCGSTLSYSQV